MRIGLTGGIASGKSTVARELERLGAVIIDADILARDVVALGTEGLKAIVTRFGEQVLAPDGSLNRRALAGIVFADPQARADLNAIIHPRVRERALELEAAAPAGAVVVHVIPLLVETGQQDDFDAVVVVDTTTEEQLRRLTRRDGLTETEAGQRLAAQASRQERLQALAASGQAFMLFEAPHRIEALAAELLQALEPEREVVMGRELTKRFEQIVRMPLAALPDWLQADANHCRGEFALLVFGPPARPESDEAAESAPSALGLKAMQVLSETMSPRQAAKLAARISGDKADRLYQSALKEK